MLTNWLVHTLKWFILWRRLHILVKLTLFQVIKITIEQHPKNKPVYTNDPILDLSGKGAHLLSAACVLGKINPCAKPCTILQAITPKEPTLSARTGMSSVKIEQTVMAPITIHLAPYFFANRPATIWGMT